MDKEIALKILRELHDKALFSERTALETLHPELKESEDERVRNELIKYLKEGVEGYIPAGDRSDYQRWIAWVKKQESVREIVERCRTSWYNEGKIDGMAEGLTNDEKYQQGWHDALEKQGEQKPMTEEFEHELAEICNQLLSEIDSEWMNNEILDCIGTSVWLNLCDETAKRYKDGLLKLAKQGEQKPAWSEEDERICRAIVCDIANDKSICKFEISKSICDEQINWLKSLKDRIGG